MSYNDLTLGRISNDLAMIRGQIAGTRLVMGTHVNAQGNLPVDERAVLQLAQELKLSAHRLEQRLAGLKAELRPLTRSVYAGSNSSSHGRLGMAKGLTRSVDHELEVLYAEVSALHAQAAAKLNDPGRWGVSLAVGPVADLFGAIEVFLEIIRMVMERKKR